MPCNYIISSVHFCEWDVAAYDTVRETYARQMRCVSRSFMQFTGCGAGTLGSYGS